MVDGVRHWVARRRIRKTRLENRSACRRSVHKLDPRHEVASHSCNGVHAAFELAEPHNGGEMADILTVENDDAGR